MKTNIKQEKISNLTLWCWEETCDKCGRLIHDVSWFLGSEEYPDTQQLDLCPSCYMELIKSKITYKEAKKLYKNNDC